MFDYLPVNDYIFQCQVFTYSISLASWKLVAYIHYVTRKHSERRHLLQKTLGKFSSPNKQAQRNFYTIFQNVYQFQFVSSFSTFLKFQFLIMQSLMMTPIKIG